MTFTLKIDANMNTSGENRIKLNNPYCNFVLLYVTVAFPNVICYLFEFTFLNGGNYNHKINFERKSEDRY